MHIGHDTCTEYHITDDDGNSNVIEQITEEKDLGVKHNRRLVNQFKNRLDKFWQRYGH